MKENINDSILLKETGAESAKNHTQALVSSFNKAIQNERSLPCLKMWLQSKDIAGIIVWQDRSINVTNTVSDGTYSEVDDMFNPDTHKKYNRALLSNLLAKKYGIIRTKSAYDESDTNIDAEEILYVINLNNDTDFFCNMMHLAQYYNQGRFFYKKAGENMAYAAGINNNEVQSECCFRVIGGDYVEKIVSLCISHTVDNGCYCGGDGNDCRTTPNPISWNDMEDKHNYAPTMECLYDYSLNGRRCIDECARNSTAVKLK